MTYSSLYKQPTTHIPTHNMFYNTATRLLGHRGARGEIFENSLQGFEYVANLAKYAKDTLVGIEFDVQLTKDNILVVFHDDDLYRLYGRQSKVDQLTYQEIKKLSKNTHPIIRLIDLLPLLKNYKHVELEVKTHERTNHYCLLRSLAETLKAFKHLQSHEYLQSIITLTSFDIRFHQLAHAHPVLSQFKRGLLVEPYRQTLEYYKCKFNTDTAIQTQPSVPITHNVLITNKNERSVLTDDNKSTSNIEPDSSLAFANDLTFDSNVTIAKHLYDLPSIAQRLSCSRIGLYYPMYNKKFMQLCKRLDINTSAWTVNDPSDAKKLVDMGVNHIITDYPSLMLNTTY